MTVPDQKTVKWLLFVMMALTLPVPYVMFVIGGFLPLSAMVYMCFTQGPMGFVLFNAVHILISGAMLYLTAWLMARFLYMWLAPVGPIVVAVFALFLVAFPFLPVYGLGHSAYQPVNMPTLFRHYL